MEQAEQEASQIRSGADEYARQVLEDLDTRLTKVLASVRNGLETL
jgi:protein involved in temperature-dependent protein secretion